MIHTCQTISQSSPATWATTNQVHGNMYEIDLSLGLLLSSQELWAFFNGQNVVVVFDLHAQDALECQKLLSEGYFSLVDFYARAACNRQNTMEYFPSQESWGLL